MNMRQIFSKVILYSCSNLSVVSIISLKSGLGYSSACSTLMMPSTNSVIRHQKLMNQSLGLDPQTSTSSDLPCRIAAPGLCPFQSLRQYPLYERHYRLDLDILSYTLSQMKVMLSLLGSPLPYKSCLIRRYSPRITDDTDMY